MSEQKSSQERIFVPVGRSTIETFRGSSPGPFLKLPTGWSGGSEYPFSQYIAYKELGRYLRMPKVKIVNRRGELCTRVVNMADQYLVVQRVEGERFDQALVNSPEKFSTAARIFITDMINMWRNTKRVTFESELAPSLVEFMRREPRETIGAFLENDEAKELLDLPLTINGEKYPPLRQICERALNHIATNTDRVVVLGHEDEHFQNLFVEEDEGEINYKIIDPRRRLYRRSPAAAVNTFLGSFLLFVFDYQANSSKKVSKERETNLRIDYAIEDKYRDAYSRVLECGREMIKGLDSLNAGEFMIKEYLFTNLIRSYIGRVAPKNVEKTQKNRIAHLAMAVQLYADFEGFMQGKYSA